MTKLGLPWGQEVGELNRLESGGVPESVAARSCACRGVVMTSVADSARRGSETSLGREAAQAGVDGTVTADQVAGLILDIPAIGRGRDALRNAGWRTCIAGNRLTVNDEVIAHFIGGGVDGAGRIEAKWMIYNIAGRPPMCIVPAGGSDR